MTTPATVIAQLKSMGNPSDLKGMARYGIRTDKAFGVKMPAIKAMVKHHKGDQDLALELWDSGYREARLLAAFIADRKQITEDLMEKWVKDFDSWDVCDTTTLQLFRYSPIALEKALEWSLSDDLFTRRSAFALMASLALKSSNLLNPAFDPFLARVKACSTDDRNLIKKSVNWALRQIGKRNSELNAKAIAVAEELMLSDNPTAKWIARDALKELRSEKVREKFKD